VLKRVEKHGDLFAPLLQQKQKLPSLAKLEQAVQRVAAKGVLKEGKPPGSAAARNPARQPARELSRKRGRA